jgi:lysophosphatidate acyltransferase
VLDPIPTANLTAADVDELTRSTREVMLSELLRLSEKVKGHPLPVPAELNGSTAKATASGVDTTAGSL